jgi:hypothetical protein
MDNKNIQNALIKSFLFAVPLAFVFNFVFLMLCYAFLAETPTSDQILRCFDFTHKYVVFWTFIHLGFAFLQAFLIFVPVIPNVSLAQQKQALWPRVFGAAFLGTLTIAIPVISAIDILRFTSFDRGAIWILIKAAGGVWMVSWLVWASVLIGKARKDPHLILRRTYAGARWSLVGMALCVPWYWVLRKKESCECSLATFYALVGGIMSLLIVGGPLLLVLARDRKIRKVFDS